MTKNLFSAFDFPFNLVDSFEHIFNVKPEKRRCDAHVWSPFPKQKFSNTLEHFKVNVNTLVFINNLNGSLLYP